MKDSRHSNPLRLPQAWQLQLGIHRHIRSGQWLYQAKPLGRHVGVKVDHSTV